MNKIFIEAKNSKTSEYCFLETILKNNFPDKSCDITCMDGVGNLFSQGILTLIRAFQDNGDNVIVILDADTIDKGWGFEARKSNTIEKMRENKIEFPFFLYPNNRDDGDFEVLLESMARKDLHDNGGIVFLIMKHALQGYVTNQARLNTSCQIGRQNSTPT